MGENCYLGRSNKCLIECAVQRCCTLLQDLKSSFPFVLYILYIVRSNILFLKANLRTQSIFFNETTWNLRTNSEYIKISHQEEFVQRTGCVFTYYLSIKKMSKCISDFRVVTMVSFIKPENIAEMRNIAFTLFLQIFQFRKDNTYVVRTTYNNIIIS